MQTFSNPRQLSRIRNLSWVTVVFTYFLMVWGNLVSSTGSGLACPDWPLCHGTVTPPISFAVVLEWGHRLLAATATLLIVATLIQVFRIASGADNAADPKYSALKKSGKVLLAFLATQILLGGTTVLLGLSITVSTIHLLVATFVWSGLILVASATTWDNPAEKTHAKAGRLALAGLAAMVIQFVLGAVVRHGHAGLACPNFPNCLEGLLPFPLTFETLIAFIHRWWGIALLGVFTHLFVATRSAQSTSRPVARAAGVVLALAVVQVLLGIATVLTGLHTHTRATHAAVGYALWGSLFYIAIRSGAIRWIWGPSPSSLARPPRSGASLAHSGAPSVLKATAKL